MRQTPRLGMLLCGAACLTLLLPTLALSTPEVGEKNNGWSLTDEVYLRTYEKCWKAFDSQCGRNIVDDGLWSSDGPSKQPSVSRVKASTATMDRWLSPPEPAPVASTDSYAETTYVPSTGSSSAYVDPACESGGDPQVYDPSGTYWGKYQYDQASWAADGGDPAAYGSADEATQDAVAANATFDRWPNC